MHEFEFTLKYTLPDPVEDPAIYLEKLGENCNDALVGIGQSGRLALQFNREADSALDAVLSALSDVKEAVPGARMIEAGPDLVGLTDLARLLNCSRQNMRKLMLGNGEFPAPVHDGKTALWHLQPVLQWLQSKQQKAVEPLLLEVSWVSMQVNLARQSAMLDKTVSERLNLLEGSV